MGATSLKKCGGNKFEKLWGQQAGNQLRMCVALFFLRCQMATLGQLFFFTHLALIELLNKPFLHFQDTALQKDSNIACLLMFAENRYINVQRYALRVSSFDVPK